MKAQVILLLIVGAVATIANPLPKQTVATDNEKTSLAERNDSETKETDEANNKEPVQKNELITDVNADIAKYGDADIDVVIEENYESPDNNFVVQSDGYLNDVPDLSVQGGAEFYNNALLNLQEETMDTAASFVPVPIFRNRQKAKRRYATRRNFYRYPFKRMRFYPYYAFYRPSYLRFY